MNFLLEYKIGKSKEIAKMFKNLNEILYKVFE